MLWKPGMPTPEAVETQRRRCEDRHAVYRDEGHDREAATRFVVDAAGDVRPPVLDVGTGQGFVAIEIARRGMPVTTIDVDEELLRKAHLNAAAAGVEKYIEYHLYDGESLPFDDASFGLVTLVNVMHHLTCAEDVLQEAARVLFPGGKLLLAEYTEEGFDILDRIHQREGRTHERFRCAEMDGLARFLSRVNLRCDERDNRFQEYVMLATKH